MDPLGHCPNCSKVQTKGGRPHSPHDPLPRHGVLLGPVPRPAKPERKTLLLLRTEEKAGLGWTDAIEASPDIAHADCLADRAQHDTAQCTGPGNRILSCLWVDGQLAMHLARFVDEFRPDNAERKNKKNAGKYYY